MINDLLSIFYGRRTYDSDSCFVPFPLLKIKCFKIRVLQDKIVPYNILLPSKEKFFKIKKKGLTSYQYTKLLRDFHCYVLINFFLMQVSSEQYHCI